MLSVLSVESTRNLCLMANVRENLVIVAKAKGKLLARHSTSAEPFSVKGGMQHETCGHRNSKR